MLASSLIFIGIIFLALKTGKKALPVFVFVMCFRLFISLANVILEGRMLGADGDANSFFREALLRASDSQLLDWDLSSLLNGTGLFLNIHAFLQALGGPNFFLSHAFSLLGSAACLVVLVKIWYLITARPNKGVTGLLLIYGFMPSLLTNQSYILREVWQSLCVLGLTWLAIVIYKQGWSTFRILGLMGFAIFGLFLHQAWVLLIPMTLILIIMLANRVSLGDFFRKPKRVAISVFGVLLAILVVLPIFSQSLHFEAVSEGSLVEKADTFSLQALQTARAEYGKIFSSSNPLTIIPSFLAYQLMPLPNRVSSVPDIIVAFERLFRVYLLWVYWRRRSCLAKHQRTICDILLSIWILHETVWSIGTINWGTASRHQVPGFSLLLICGWVARYSFELLKTKSPVKKLDTCKS